MSIRDMKIAKFGFLSFLSLFLAVAPAFAADDSLEATQTVSEAPPPSEPATLPRMALVNAEGIANFGPSSGTVVGNRASALREEVARLRSSVSLNSNEFAILRTSGAAGAVQYHSTVAAITARLQNGTTRGNPILLRQWSEAEASLNEVTSSLNKLNSLRVAIDNDASVASYLFDSVEAAFELAGAVDEDHDQLKLLKDEVSRQVVQLDYLRNETTSDIQRQSSYLATERANIQALAFAISRGEMLGNSLANRPVIVNQPAMAVTPAVSPIPHSAPLMPVTQDTRSLAPTPVTAGPEPAGAQSLGHLLVLIRYNQPHVEYEQQLSQAVGTVIERHPNAAFSVVAVAPGVGDSALIAEQQQMARSHADEVKRSLIQLGLQPSHISMASTQAQTAQTPEVHVYIR